jgi:transposase
MPYVDHLEARFAAGCRKPTQLFKEIQALGYPGTQPLIGRWLTAHTFLAGEDAVAVKTGLQITNSSSILPSNYKMSWLMAPEKLDEDEQKMLIHLRIDDVINRFYELEQDFRRIVAEFDDWLTCADQVSVKTVKNFAKALRDEHAFIQASLVYEWNKGQTERQINRLKFIKHQMYGRASFDLLRQKVLYYPGFT